MTPEQKERIRELFLAACEQDPHQRPAFLRLACQGDELVRREVESLLASDDETATFLQTPALGKSFAGADPESFLARVTPAAADGSCAGVGAPEPPPAKLPEHIGQYRILGILGKGGMGIVYRAEQESPRRPVALKVIRPGVELSEALERFRREGQMLGRLQHPGIAQVFEAGTADTGLGSQPFFAMELVDGQSLTHYAHARKLGIRARLELIAKVCDAVNHAHQKGVIHRDLKPGNILVGETGQPKILDFGVARATDADVRTATLRTAVGQLVGTIAYMSPEQIEGDPHDLDTRSDIYSLGVILYELLTGRTLVDTREKTLAQAARMIVEEEPTSLGSVNRTFRGDIETIVAKALEKDKDRRYQSASALAQDIRRHLSDEPISARPASTFYQFRKFARRNKPVVAAVAVAFVLLCGALIHVTMERNRAVAAERLAAQQAAIARAVNDFLNEDLLAAASPENLGRDGTMREVLDHAAERVEGRFEDEPLVEAAIRATLGETYHKLGDYTAGVLHFERALELRREELGKEHPATLTSMCDLALINKYLGRWDVAEPLFIAALEGRRRVLGDEHPATLQNMSNLATLYYDKADFENAEPLLLKAVAGLERVYSEDSPEFLGPMNNLANVYARQGRLDEAEPLFVKTLEGKQRLYGHEHPRSLVAMNNLANVYCLQGRYDEAEPLYAKTLEIRRRVLGDEHPRTFGSVGNLGFVYVKQGRYDEAEPLYMEAVEGMRRLLGEEHPQTLLRMTNLAALYHDQGHYDEAEKLYTETLEIRRLVVGEGHPDNLSCMFGLAETFVAMRKFEQAESMALKCYESYMRMYAPDHFKTRDTIELLVALYEAWDKLAQSAAWRAKLPTTQPASEF